MSKDFEGLREKLAEQSFPCVYMFKFIVKTELSKMAKLESLFDANTAEISRKESSKGAYVSLTVKEVMMGVDEIIEVYEKVSKIEGVIAL